MLAPILAYELWSLLLSFGVQALLFALLGAAVYYCGWRLRRHKVRSGRVPHCAVCDYNLTGLASDICPECGTSRTNQTVAYGDAYGVRTRQLAGTIACIIGAGIVVASLVVVGVLILVFSF